MQLFECPDPALLVDPSIVGLLCCSSQFPPELLPERVPPTPMLLLLTWMLLFAVLPLTVTWAALFWTLRFPPILFPPTVTLAALL